MKVKVKYFAYIRSLVKNTREEEVELSDGAKLLDLLLKLVEKYGVKLGEMIFQQKDEKLSEEVIILLNGRSIEDLNTVLRDGDVVSIMPFLSGG